ncbi:MAG: undecaprenyl/decaprenyl-phosphate alpha-N-acetylglucosaminyl 1-phosphate transferase [Candidatus Krumholzibacteriota bacterium]|nr:undecaprenyl/decaprenyl-phosphate alpha-N-acetylglucosaminyl 1-phosphate transferase [Candidatus Krumholzibacteriota bacterium]
MRREIRGEKLTIPGFILPLILSFVFGLVFTPLTIAIAVRWNIVEKPNGRNTREIAHIGGVAIIGSILFSLIPAFLFFLPSSRLNGVFVPILIASGFITFILGIIDDLRSLHYLYKLFFQIAVSLLVSGSGIGLLEHFGILSLPIPFAFVAFILSSVWMLVVTTSFNLIDGLDGLASGIAVISSGAFFAAGLIYNIPLVMVLSAVVFGVTLAFLGFNFPPARIFMGDSGSLFLGLIFGLMTLLLIANGENIFYRIAGSLIILSIPLMDCALAFIRRLLTGRPPFEADHMHLHHILLYRLGSVRKVDFLLWGITAFFSMLGVFTMRYHFPVLISASVIELLVFGIALRDMVKNNFSMEKMDKLICGYGPAGTTPVSGQNRSI